MTVPTADLSIVTDTLFGGIDTWSVIYPVVCLRLICSVRLTAFIYTKEKSRHRVYWCLRDMVMSMKARTSNVYSTGIGLANWMYERHIFPVEIRCCEYNCVGVWRY